MIFSSTATKGKPWIYLMAGISLGFLIYSCSSPEKESKTKPRVLITTDINNAGGDPDDKQSLVHLLWYSNELEIEGIIPDYWTGNGYEASMEVLDAYRRDFEDYGFASKGYPHPDTILNRIVKNKDEASGMILNSARKSIEQPLYVLAWGQMTTLKDALFAHPEIADKIRVLSIGTGLKYGPKDEVAGEECNVPNWNGKGRAEIYEDLRFDQMWWVESNWTYNGMFGGEEPKEMLSKLTRYGAMGSHIKAVTSKHKWAQYFRVGDTPSVLYLIDPSNDHNDPEKGSWAGSFIKPFPGEKNHYYTDDSGPVDWDYKNPCNSWENVKEMYAYNKSTLAKRRGEMYLATLEKLNEIYNK